MPGPPSEPHSLPTTGSPPLGTLAPGTSSPTSPSSTQFPLTSPVTQSPPGPALFYLIKGAYSALNATHSELTTSCWLCLSASPPYYEGVASNGTISSTTACSWDAKPGLTLPEVRGKGTCIRTAPTALQDLKPWTLILLIPIWHLALAYGGPVTQGSPLASLLASSMPLLISV